MAPILVRFPGSIISYRSYISMIQRYSQDRGQGSLSTNFKPIHPHCYFNWRYNAAKKLISTESYLISSQYLGHGNKQTIWRNQCHPTSRLSYLSPKLISLGLKSFSTSAITFLSSKVLSKFDISADNANILQTALSYEKERTELYEHFNQRTEPILKEMYQISPHIEQIMQKPVNMLTPQEIDKMALWRSLNQDYHTLRRRLFMTESELKINHQTHLPKTKAEIQTEEKLGQMRQQIIDQPWHNLAQLWANELLWQKAQLHNIALQKNEFTQASRDPSEIPQLSGLKTLMPRHPLSRQGQVTQALQNEDQITDTCYSAQHLEASRLASLERLSYEDYQNINANKTIYLSSSENASESEVDNQRSLPKLSDADKGLNPKPNIIEDGKSVGHDNKKDTSTSMSTTQKLKLWIQKNGPLGIVLLLVYGVADILIIYLALTYLNLHALIYYIGFSHSSVGVTATFALAYAIHKMILPLRLALVMYTSPKIRPYWNKMIENIKNRF